MYTFAQRNSRKEERRPLEQRASNIASTRAREASFLTFFEFCVARPVMRDIRWLDSKPHRLERRAGMTNRDESRPATPHEAVVEVKSKEQEVVEVVDRNLGRAINVLEKRQELAHEQAVRRLGIDRGILFVFAISLLASLGVMFYLIVMDRLNAVTSVLYPLVSLVIGFMSSYFAGSGRGARRS